MKAGCSNYSVLNDVWASKDIGSTWRCLTVDYTGTGGYYSRYVGRFASVVMARDDTIYIVGGDRNDAPGSTDRVLQSYEANHKCMPLTSWPQCLLWFPFSRNRYFHKHYSIVLVVENCHIDQQDGFRFSVFFFRHATSQGYAAHASIIWLYIALEHFAF